MNKRVSSIIKMLLSLGLGVLIIVLVARNFSKPLKIKLEGVELSQDAEWSLSEWTVGVGDYIYVGDTIAYISTESRTTPYVSIFEGELVASDVSAGSAVFSGAVIARVKVDIWKIIGEAFARANYWWVLLSIVLSLISHVSRAMRWRMMFKPMGYEPGLGNAFSAVMVNYLANLAFPRLGEVLRCTILSRYEKIPIHKSLGTMITERVLDVICLGVVFLLMIFLQRDIFYEFYNTYMPEQQGGMMKVYLLGGMALAFVVGFLLYRSGRLPFRDKIRELATGLWDGIRSIRQLDRPWLFIFHTVLIWVMYFWMTAVTLGILSETSTVSALAGFPMLFFGGIAMVAVQGGLGLYPYFISKILLLYGVAETVGYAFGWIMWTAQTVLVIVGGLLAMLFLTLYNRRSD